MSEQTFAQLFSITEAAECLKISPTTIRRRVHEGKFPHHRIGAKIYFTTENLESYLNSCSRPAQGLVR